MGQPFVSACVFSFNPGMNMICLLLHESGAESGDDEDIILMCLGYSFFQKTVPIVIVIFRQLGSPVIPPMVPPKSVIVPLNVCKVVPSWNSTPSSCM